MGKNYISYGSDLSCRRLCAVPHSAGNAVLFIFVVFAALYAGTAFAQSASDAPRIPGGSEVVGAPMMLSQAEQASQDASAVPDAGVGSLSDEEVNNLDDEAFDALFDEAEGAGSSPPVEGEQFLMPDDAAPVYNEGGASDQINFIERPDDDLLIVEVVVDETAVLDPGIIIYADEDGIVLPLAVMTDLFGFPINVNASTGVASGWFINKNNTFDLKPPYQQVMIAGETIDIPPGSIENHYDDIFVRQELFEKWFSVKTTLNFNELRLYVEPLEDLPFQAQAERRERWDRLQNQARSPGGVKPENVVELPYKKYAPPTISLNHTLDVSDSNNGSEVQTTHNVQSQGDVLGMNLRLTGSYRTSSVNENEVDSLRATLSKRDFDGTLLGPLQATQFEIGDVRGAALPLAPSGKDGRGISFSNRPVNCARSAVGFVIDGFGPVGYDVEVYRDDQLLDFQTIGSDGQYLFDDINLRAGFNFFRVILYGPNGEQEERFERFYLGRSNVNPGEFQYEFSALQSETPLYDPENDGEKQTPGAVSFIGEYGLNEFATLNTTLFQGRSGDQVIRGAGVGATLSAANTFTEFNVFQTEDNARSVELNVTGNLSPTLSWQFGHITHNNYDIDVRSIKRNTSLAVFKQLSLGALGRGSVSFRAQERKSDTNIVSQSFLGRGSANIFGWNLSNDLEYTRQVSSEIDDLRGRFTVRKRLPFGLVRGRLGYSLDDQYKGLENYDMQLQKRISQDLVLNSILSGNLRGERDVRFQSALDWELEKFRLRFDASVSDTKDYSAGVNLAYNFVPQSMTGDYKMTGSTLDISSGTVLLRPFVDLNQNGIYDEDEPTLEGVEFENKLRGRKAKSNENGVAALGGIAPDVPNRIEIEQETLPDIYLIAQKQDFYVLGKRGVNGPIDFPMDKLGEIAGTLYGVDPETQEMIPLENVDIYLLDDTGEVIAEATTEFDGFYLFPSLPMGSYEMFFPKSTSLDAYYSGQGTGPRFTLTVDRPELTAEDIVFAGERVDLLEPARETGIQPDVNNTDTATDEIQEDAALKPDIRAEDEDQGFFALKIKSFFEKGE